LPKRFSTAALEASARRRSSSFEKKIALRYCVPASQNWRSLAKGSTLRQKTSSRR
jgi:hypothetical protein